MNVKKVPHRTCHVCKGPLQGTNIGRALEKELGNSGGSNITESLAAMPRQTRCLYKWVYLNLTDYQNYLKELHKYKFSDSISPTQTRLWLIDSQVWNVNLIWHYLHQYYRQDPVRTPATVAQGSIVCAKRKEWPWNPIGKLLGPMYSSHRVCVRLNTRSSGFLQLWTHSCLEKKKTSNNSWS